MKLPEETPWFKTSRRAEVAAISVGFLGRKDPPLSHCSRYLYDPSLPRKLNAEVEDRVKFLGAWGLL